MRQAPPRPSRKQRPGQRPRGVGVAGTGCWPKIPSLTTDRKKQLMDCRKPGVSITNDLQERPEFPPEIIGHPGPFRRYRHVDPLRGTHGLDLGLHGIGHLVHPAAARGGPLSPSHQDPTPDLGDSQLPFVLKRRLVSPLRLHERDWSFVFSKDGELAPSEEIFGFPSHIRAGGDSHIHSYERTPPAISTGTPGGTSDGRQGECDKGEGP